MQSGIKLYYLSLSIFTCKVQGTCGIFSTSFEEFIVQNDVCFRWLWKRRNKRFEKIDNETLKIEKRRFAKQEWDSPILWFRKDAPGVGWRTDWCFYELADTFFKTWLLLLLLLYLSSEYVLNPGDYFSGLSPSYWILLSPKVT